MLSGVSSRPAALRRKGLGAQSELAKYACFSAPSRDGIDNAQKAPGCRTEVSRFGATPSRAHFSFQGSAEVLRDHHVGSRSATMHAAPRRPSARRRRGHPRRVITAVRSSPFELRHGVDAGAGIEAFQPGTGASSRAGSWAAGFGWALFRRFRHPVFHNLALRHHPRPPHFQPHQWRFFVQPSV